MASLFVKLIIIFATAAFHKVILPNIPTNTLAVAQLFITPSWNINDTENQECILQNDIEDHVIIRSSSSQFCSFEVFSPSNDTYVFVQYLSTITKGYVPFWVERIGLPSDQCMAKYIIVDDLQSKCDVTFSHSHLIFNMHDGTSLLMKEISSNEAYFRCPEEKNSLTLAPTCSRIVGQSETITCTIKTKFNTKHRQFFSLDNPCCEYHFQSSCNVILEYKHQIKFQCSNNAAYDGQKQVIKFQCSNNAAYDGQKQVIIYNPKVDIIDLRKHKIVAINKGAFWGLTNLTGLILSQNKFIKLADGSFQGLDNLNTLLTVNGQIEILEPDVFQDVKKLSSLVLNDNKIKMFPKGVFRNLHQLKQLHLTRNYLTSITGELVADLTKLKVLQLANNSLTELDNGMFQILTNLRAIALHNNFLERLPIDMFRNIGKFDQINYISLNNCKLRSIPNVPFLSKLRYFHLEDNPLTGIQSDTFSMVNPLTEVSVSQHEICECYINKNAICHASEDRSPYLTCDRLLSDRVLVVLMWIIGLNALGGNAFVLVLKCISSDKNTVQDILLGNLAMSDLLMGVYMVIIASADVYFGDYFPMNSESWRSGILCRLSGSISIMSSEGSVFFL